MVVKKREIRRAVHVTCVVFDGGSDGLVPARVTLRVKRPRGCCMPWPAASRQVAVFNFGERPRQARLPVSVTALVDLEHLYKVQRKASASAAEVKVCVEHPREGRRVARVGLDDFLGQLMRSGRPEWAFLHVYEGKVTLVQANQPMSGVVPEWPFDGAGSGRQTGEGVMPQDKGEENAPEVSEEHDKVNGTAPEETELQDNGKDKASAERTENGDTKDSPEYTGEECTRGRDRVMKDNLEHAGERCGRDADEDGTDSLEHTEEECGRDRDGYDKEEDLKHTREKCEGDGDEDDQESIEHTDEREYEDYENDEWEDDEDGFQVEEAARDWNDGSEEDAEVFMRSEDEGEKRMKAAAGVSVGGGRRFPSWTWRLARRALVVICLVIFLMVILDPLLPPYDEEDLGWGGGGGFEADLSELWGWEEGRRETLGYLNTEIEKILKNDL